MSAKVKPTLKMTLLAAAMISFSVSAQAADGIQGQTFSLSPKVDLGVSSYLMAATFILMLFLLMRAMSSAEWRVVSQDTKIRFRLAYAAMGLCCVLAVFLAVF